MNATTFKRMTVFKTPWLLLPASAEGLSLATIIHWIFRISCAGTYIGHGVHGVVTTQAWLPYFAVTHIGPDAAYPLMRIIGALDITFGLLILIKPLRVLMLHLTIWGIWTALLRPLAGEGWWEFLVRAGNYGVPFAFLIYSGGGKSIKDWFSRIQAPELTEDRIQKLKLVLRLTIGLLLIGHGGFGAFMHKEMLIKQFASVGLPGSLMNPNAFLTLAGWFEIALGVSVLVKPLRPILLLVFFWKVFTELLYPISGIPVYPFPGYVAIACIARIGSLAAPLGLFILMTYGPNPHRIRMHSAAVPAGSASAVR